MSRIATTIAALTAVVALGLGVGVATAADQPATPSLVDAVAAKLGLTPDQLRAAFKDAVTAQIDAAVKSGRLTPEQAAKIKERIADGKGLGLGGRAGFEKRGKELRQKLVDRLKRPGAAATYLGLTNEQLRTQLRSGKSLAQIATATNGKSVDGLVAAMTASAKERLAKAVTDGKLTQARADEILKSLTERTQKLVQKQFQAKQSK